MASIRHFSATHPLPDWRNSGVVLRILLASNAASALLALFNAPQFSGWLDRFYDISALLEPLLIFTLSVLALLRTPLRRLPLRLAQALVLLITGSIAALLDHLLGTILFSRPGNLWRDPLLACLMAGMLLYYYELRTRAFSPAQSEARLAALNARIRPHFLFNSLNAVLSLIRARPRDAEAALESLADLFRAAMHDAGELVSLADEIDLGRQYIALEQLRLGERLTVDWQIGPVSPTLPIPPLMLQPLLENAVYHGIEPSAAGGLIRVNITEQGGALHIAIRNPLAEGPTHLEGNHMALANIRERLALYYDLEAHLETERSEQHFETRITLPCRPSRL